MTIEEINNIMKKIEYGWIDKNGNKSNQVDDTFSSNYILQTPTEVLTHKIGVCWDQVELERYLFKDYEIKTYFICHYDNDKCPTHTFLVYKSNNKYNWYEHSWNIYKGIRTYNSINELLKDVKQKFITTELKNNYNNNNLLLREYKKPNYHISVIEFYKHCEKNGIIDI